MIIVVKGFIPKNGVWAAWVAPTTDHLKQYFAASSHGVKQDSFRELPVSAARRIESFAHTRRELLELVRRHGTVDAVPLGDDAVFYLGFVEERTTSSEERGRFHGNRALLRPLGSHTQASTFHTPSGRMGSQRVDQP